MGTKKPTILVSACLLGEPCRYDGQSKPCASIIALSEWATLVPVCPESDGGLPTPRIPSERQGDRVRNRLGADVTLEYCKGAKLAQETAKAQGCICAILKEKSPSCGTHFIYDGTFRGKVIPGLGVTAELLQSAGFLVFSEDEIDDAWLSTYLPTAKKSK